MSALRIVTTNTRQTLIGGCARGPGLRHSPIGRLCPRCGERKANQRFFALPHNPEGREGSLKGGGRVHKTCGSCRADANHGRKRVPDVERDRRYQQARTSARA